MERLLVRSGEFQEPAQECNASTRRPNVFLCSNVSRELGEAYFRELPKYRSAANSRVSQDTHVPRIITLDSLRRTFRREMTAKPCFAHSCVLPCQAPTGSVPWWYSGKPVGDRVRERAVVPLTSDAAQHVLAWEDGSRRAVALHHALIRHRGELWGDHSKRPQSVVLLRPGDGQCEAFGAGAPEPAIAWLARREGPVALLAPDSWTEAVHATVGMVEHGRVQTRFRPEPPPPGSPPPTVAARHLMVEDVERFAAVAPDWALRGWDSPAELLTQGAAFGVPFSEGLAAVAWISELDHTIDLLSIYVVSRFRRLGLGHAVATALVDHIILNRRKCPLWVTTGDNLASRNLGRRLGFSLLFHETLFRWPPVDLAARGKPVEESAEAD
jgi:GNAT superfamily N-acetyltransferase